MVSAQISADRTSSPGVQAPRYIVVQHGARRGYAVPAILERAGMLERFYTDACGSVGIGRAAAWLRRLPLVGGEFRKLHNRRLPAEVVSKTRAFGQSTMASSLRSMVSNRDAAKTLADHFKRVDSIGLAMIQAGFGSASHVFSMLGEGGPFLAAAKRRGLTVISEVYILLSSLRIVAAERRAFPDWEEAPGDAGADALIEEQTRIGLLTHSNAFICPSPAVRDDLAIAWGVDPARCTVVPYGMDPRWLALEPRPTPGRVLFVGTAELRKGIHYLAMAAERLRTAGHQFEFRVAGDVSPQIAGMAACRHLKFLGRVPRERIAEEFQQADVFVLPSLAEGSAEVTYEALAAGVPVVTTPASGSVVRDGVDGLIVPERDETALATAIAEIVGDRARRDRMAASAREHSRDYTWDRYGERLLAALKNCDLSDRE